MTTRILLHMVIFMTLLLTLDGCSDDGGQNPPGPPSETSRQTGTVAPSPATGDAASLIQKGEDAFKAARYKDAVSFYRQAVLLTQPVSAEPSGSPKSEDVWTLYNQALLAWAGDQYLSSIPKDRYEIPPGRFSTDIKQGRRYFIVDVREPYEFDKGHLEGAINVPLRGFMKHLDLLPGKDALILLVCHTERRANHVMVILRELGYSNVYVLKSGYEEYLKWLKNPKEGGDGPQKGDKGPSSSHPPKNSPKDSGEEEDFGC
jgi:rhodanese-related sulfurtransferase